MQRLNYLLSIPLCICILVLPAALTAQSKKDSTKYLAVKEMISSQLYTFKAQNVTPLAGRLRQLDLGYDLQVSKDKIVSQLPYFGRAYSASMDPSKAGFQFVSKDFTYALTKKKKAGWTVLIKYRDAGDVQQMQLSIFENGSASLQVISNNRQSISFNGYVSAPDTRN